MPKRYRQGRPRQDTPSARGMDKSARVRKEAIMRTSPRAFLEGLFKTAVAAAHPAQCLPARLPPPPSEGRLIILAAGKAAGAMAEVAEGHYLHKLPAERIGGVAVTRRGYGRPTRLVKMIE